MKKYLLGAITMPMLIVSCTQDALVEDLAPSNAPNAKGFNVELVAQKGGDGDATRSYNKETGTMFFEGSDQINMYWLNGNPGENVYNQKFNSIFNIVENIEEGTSTFRSASLVYGGYNVATYPGNYVTSQGNVQLTVNNDINGIKNLPYISNLMNLDNAWAVHNDNSGDLRQGYNNKLKIYMKPAANYSKLNMDIINIATGIAGYEGEGLQVRKVVFKDDTTDGKPFATTANLKTVNGTVKTNGEFVYYTYDDGRQLKETPIVNVAFAEPTSASNSIESYATEVVYNNNNLASTTGKVWTMTFPTQSQTEGGTDGTAIAANKGSIEVHTNMGIVTIETKYDNGTNITPLRKDGDVTTVEAFLNKLTTKLKATSGTFEGELIGKEIERNLTVDMKGAKLNGSEVRNSKEIIRYIDLYNKIGSTEEVTLNTTWDFQGLTVDAINKLENANKFKLNVYGDAVKVLDGGNVRVLKGSKIVNSTVEFELASGKNWAIDQNANLKPERKTFTIKNSGNLTITNNNGKGKDKPLAYALTNNGSITINADNLFLSAFTNNDKKSLTVPAGKAMNLTAASTLNGTIDINGQVVVYDETTTIKGTVNNNGFLACLNGYGQIENQGTINIGKDNMQTLLTTNDGTINLYARNDQVSVPTNNGIIAITSTRLGTNEYKWMADDKMNKIIVDNGDFTFTSLPGDSIKHMDINCNARLFAKMIDKDGIANDRVLQTLTVKEGKTLTINTNNVIYTYNLTVEKNAKIFVAGTLKYGALAGAGKDNILTAGSAADVDYIDLSKVPTVVPPTGGNTEGGSTEGE